MTVERTSLEPDARFKVTLRETCELTTVTLMRGGREMVLAIDPASSPRA